MYSMFSNSLRSGYTRPYTPVWTPYCSNQWLAAPDSDGIISDKRGLLSRPVYTGNGCKAFDGIGDRLITPYSFTHTSGISRIIWSGCIDSTIGDWKRIIENHATLELASTGFSMYIRSTSSLRFQVYANGVETTLAYAGTFVDVCVWLMGEIDHDTGTISLYQKSTENSNWTLVSSQTVAAYIGASFDGTPVGIGYRPTRNDVFFKGKMYYTAIQHGNTEFEYTYAAGPALVEWDRSGNGNHGTYTTTSGINTMATTSDLVKPWNILNGFSLYTHATLPVLRVPYDINGDPLSITPPTGYTLASEHPGGYLHNGAESGVKQTDDLFIGGTPNFYSADGETQDDKTYADFLAHHPFDLGLLLQWEDVAGVCMLKEAIQMPFAYMWVPLWYIAALAYIQTYTAACGASPLVPDEVTPGTGIGPDLDWADNGSGKVLLVEDV